MPNTGVVVTQTGVDALPLTKQLPIAIAGICSTGSLTANTLTRIRSKADATTLLGEGNPTDTLPLAVKILQRYGCGNLIVIKAENNTEAELLAAINLIPNSLTSLGVAAQIILATPFHSSAIINSLENIATTMLAIALCNPAPGETISQVIAERGTAEGIGIKSERIVVCYPYLKNAITPTTIEPLSLHLAGILANLDNYGQSPLNKPLLGISAPELPMTFSYSSDTSDNEKLNDKGVLTININPEGKYVIWGARNSKYSEGATDILTFINAVRARDEITRLTEARAIKMLGQPSNFATASLLTESYRNMLNEQINSGAIKSYTKVAINPDKTDYSNFKIYHDIEFQAWAPTEFIGASVAITVSN